MYIVPYVLAVVRKDWSSYYIILNHIIVIMVKLVLSQNFAITRMILCNLEVVPS